MEVEANFENKGTLKGESGALRFVAGSVVELGSSVLEGTIENYGTMTGGAFNARNADLILVVGPFSVTSGSTATVGTLELAGGSAILTGAGTVDVSGTLTTHYAEMRGTGATVILPGATAVLNGANSFEEEHILVNEGTATLASEADLTLGEHSELINSGTFRANSESFPPELTARAGETGPLVVNTGRFTKTEGTGTTKIAITQNGSDHQPPNHVTTIAATSAIATCGQPSRAMIGCG